jgi:hypothetical protein
MTTWLLALVIMLGSSAENQTPLMWKGACKMAMRVKGRLLGSLVQKGMTIEDVEQILGRSSYFYWGWATGAASHITLNYDVLGVSVSLIHRRNEDRGHRVDEVTFKSLFNIDERLVTQKEIEEETLRAFINWPPSPK